MTTKTKAQKAHALVNYFVSEWTAKYGRKPQINRYRDRWGFESMIDDLGYDRSKEIIDFYFKTDKPGHPAEGLLYKYDELNVTFEELKTDAEKRAELRRATEKRVKEWEAKHGKQ